MTDVEQNLKRIVARWMQVGWQKPEREAFLSLHAETFIDHSASGRASDLGAFWRGVQELYEAFPDFHATIDDLVIDAKRGMAVVRWSAAATNQGAFLGQPPTGRPVSFTGIEILRIEDERIQERWGEWNGGEVIESVRTR
jgi:steroid delta-isomerase-like uncharacterized protein